MRRVFAPLNDRNKEHTHPPQAARATTPALFDLLSHPCFDCSSKFIGTLHRTNDAPLYSPFLIVPFQYPDMFQNDAQIGCLLRTSYDSGSSPKDCDAKPVNLGPVPEFLNIICQRQPAKTKPLRQPIYDVKYFTNRILFLSFSFLILT